MQPSSNQVLRVIAGVLFLLTFALAASAQSGRRLPSSKPIAAPTPEPTPTPVVKEKSKPAISVILGIESDSFFVVPLNYYSAALAGCAERLEESPSVKVSASQRHMSRSEAIKLAKSEKESYVVWLQLRADSLDADRGAANTSDVYLDYVLFAPGTAKQIAAGRTYPGSVRKGGVIANPRGRTGNIYGEYLVKEAGREAGERILSELRLPGRPIPP